ncbi:bi-domain-containing oxidoreductase [Bdellovibrio sp. HCB288]|uniref:bi-domain-containing oxidoreductase n=1 Tax=Bdellovibrio sp. HCB288 TaxID=3394355 RepID=UPI0039B55F8A
MKQVLIQGGNILVEEVPSPVVEAGHVLVQVQSSCISAGTELSGIRSSAVPLWKKALKQPEKVKRVIDVAINDGLVKAINLVEKTKTWLPVGYSAAGVVVAVGEGILDIKVGDRVACAGAQCAYHAEVISVPRNLTVVIPSNVSFAHASTVTLGAIAMQGVRRLNPTLGEVFAVVGLGILGQMTVQLLKANGCRVIALDLDKKRVELAKQCGADFTVDPDLDIDVEAVMRMTAGYGVDGVIVTAATSSHSVISTAFKMCRKKGRVVLVGDVGLNIDRNDIYMKELDFLVSTSYGPGRYDAKYEDEGLDYPISYVRWTENRNLSEFLNLISSGAMRLDSLIQAEFDLEMAAKAYEEIRNSIEKPLIVLLKYKAGIDQILERKIELRSANSSKADLLRVGVIGAGGFAQYAHLPNMKSISDFKLSAIVTRSGHKGVAVAKQFGADYATTDYQEVLADPNINMVVVATRHDSHMAIALDALKRGKHVLLEKPLCISSKELEDVKSYFSEKTDGPILMTGFNRRFSPAIQKVKSSFGEKRGPLIINYRMNAGFIPLDSWVHGKEGGGRNIGEACHIYDLFTFLTGSKVIDIKVQSVGSVPGGYSNRDNFVASFYFEDGSIASLTYTSMGHTSLAKERMELFVDGKSIVLDDYKSLEFFGPIPSKVNFRVQDKGQHQELVEFARAVKTGGSWPIPLWEQVQATEMSFVVESLLSE